MKDSHFYSWAYTWIRIQLGSLFADIEFDEIREDVMALEMRSAASAANGILTLFRKEALRARRTSFSFGTIEVEPSAEIVERLEQTLKDLEIETTKDYNTFVKPFEERPTISSRALEYNDTVILRKRFISSLRSDLEQNLGVKSFTVSYREIAAPVSFVPDYENFKVWANIIHEAWSERKVKQLGEIQGLAAARALTGKAADVFAPTQTPLSFSFDEHAYCGELYRVAFGHIGKVDKNHGRWRNNERYYSRTVVSEIDAWVDFVTELFVLEEDRMKSASRR